MKATHAAERCRFGQQVGTGACAETLQRVRRAIHRTKQDILNRHAETAGEHVRVLRLALNEAEALAWNTEFPHLFFPVLAMEKAEATVAWHRRQRVVRRAGGELSFAE